MWTTSLFAVVRDACPFVGPFSQVPSQAERDEEEAIAPYARQAIASIAKLSNTFFRYIHYNHGWEALPTKAQALDYLESIEYT